MKELLDPLLEDFGNPLVIVSKTIGQRDNDGSFFILDVGRATLLLLCLKIDVRRPDIRPVLF